MIVQGGVGTSATNQNKKKLKTLNHPIIFPFIEHEQTPKRFSIKNPQHKNLQSHQKETG